MSPWGIPEEIIDKAAQDLALEVPIEHAYITSGGVLVLVTRYGANEVPAPAGYGKTDTLPTPHTGSNDPGSSSPSANHPPADEHFSGGSVPPREPEPPKTARQRIAEAGLEPVDTTGSGLDDFTAIDGVGPVTAQKLHDEGLYTYDQLPTADLQTIVGLSTYLKILGWLEKQRLV